MVGWLLNKLPVPGRPANLDYRRARASVLAVGAGVFGLFFLIYNFSLSLSLGHKRLNMFSMDNRGR